VETISNIAFLIGRVAVRGFFLISGFNQLTQLSVMAGYAKSKETPAPSGSVAGSGVLLLLGGASLLLGYYPTVGAVLLVICLLGLSIAIHNFWAVQEPQARLQEQVNFMKNVALLGFAPMTLVIPRP
jgi:putative oxidoreductase